MRRLVMALTIVALSSLPELLGGIPHAHATAAGYDLWVEQKVPDWSVTGFAPPCILGSAKYCSLAYAEVVQSPGAPGYAPTWIDLFCQVWNKDSQGVVHTDEAEVITTPGGYALTSTSTSGIGLILQQGPTSTTGSSGFFAVQGSDSGYIGTGTWAGTSFTNSGSAIGFYRGGPTITGVSGVFGGLMTAGFASIDISGTIFHQHYVGTTSVSDGTTQGSISCSVLPSPHSDVFATAG